MTASRRILVLRLSSLGDIILATPFLRCMKAAWADCELHVAVRAEYADLLRHDGRIAALHPVDAAAGFGGLLRLRRELRRLGFDEVFDLHNSLRTRVLRSGLAPRVRVVRKQTVRRFLLVACKHRIQPVVPVAERYIATASDEGIVPDGHGPEIIVAPDVEQRMRAALDALGRDASVPAIALCPGAKHATKRWPPAHAAEFIRLLCERTRCQVLVLGAEEDAPLGRELAAVDPARVVDCCGRFTLPESAAALSTCAAAVTNDSGLMHLATARGVPVLALFGSTVRDFGFFPYASPARVLETEGLDCRPCHRHGRVSCPKGHFACMQSISAEDALEALRELTLL